MTEPSGRDKAFVDSLHRLAAPENAHGRGALAALRRGLGKGPGEAPEMFPYVVPFAQELQGWVEECYYLVASLFALHPSPTDAGAPRTMGASLRSAALKERQEVTLPESDQRRFVALLSSDRRELPHRLRHAVALCGNKDVPVHWEQLLRDVRAWDAPRVGSQVKLRWGRDFWPAQEQTESKGE
ncbi:MAG TPA: type I-E CRISPR-associated protein Cse2/CasB [Chloroflexota bacterium]|nr:type I-E CRISPR-associated protein Cse2/CasB [Chloroflexota bacterium]